MCILTLMGAIRWNSRQRHHAFEERGQYVPLPTHGLIVRVPGEADAKRDIAFRHVCDHKNQAPSRQVLDSCWLGGGGVLYVLPLQGRSRHRESKWTEFDKE